MNTHACGNFRVWLAIEDVRHERNAATMAELYDALNSRSNRRPARLTPAERQTLNDNYLRQNAPDLRLKTSAVLRAQDTEFLHKP